ncbi:MAG: N-acetylmuramoyl-L-alanine amidase [Candidatus Glassbacteria bacterium]|nr:N-acetylmuramoyl-L-alanine amidase [Candidatus Glassbacteria bacterium]
MITSFRKSVIKPALIGFCLLVSYFCTGLLRAADTDSREAGAEQYVTVRMGGSLWNTLIDNGVDPTQWRYIFEFNRERNPAFARITSAKRIPRGVTIYIPFESEGDSPIRRRQPARPRSSTVQDTVKFHGDEPFLKIKTGRGQSLSNVVRQFCMPEWSGDKRLRESMVRTISSDIRDIYRRAGEVFSYRSAVIHVPLYLTEEHYNSLADRHSSLNSSPESYVARERIYPLGERDIKHTAAPGETYADLAGRYVAPASEWPSTYTFHDDPERHARYLAQQIRHYNMNQPLWPGKLYYIPSYLLNNRYVLSKPVVGLKKKTKNKLVYDNGLEISLSHHVTRRKTYYRRRQKYLPPLKRQFGDGSAAYPDMIIWHRTGIEPEVEEALREKKRSQFSLNYIYRMAVTNFYIDESGNCFLVVDPDKNPRDHSGSPADYRCFWNGQNRVSDVSIGIEIEAGFTSVITAAQLETARKLQQVIRSIYIIPDERVLDHRKVATRRGPGNMLLRGRKADGLTASERRAIGIAPVLDPDVLRGLVLPNLNEISSRRADSTDFWYKVEIDPDLVATARRAGWRLDGRIWTSPSPGFPDRESIQSSFD